MIWLYILIFLIPAIIAWVRDLSSRTAITLFNILIGIMAIFGLGYFGMLIWFILLLWSIIGRPKDKPEVKVIVENKEKKVPETKPSYRRLSVETAKEADNKESETKPSESVKEKDSVEQLIKLAEMKDKGLLSEEEYEVAKQKVLHDKPDAVG